MCLDVQVVVDVHTNTTCVEANAEMYTHIKVNRQHYALSTITSMSVHYALSTITSMSVYMSALASTQVIIMCVDRQQPMCNHNYYKVCLAYMSTCTHIPSLPSTIACVYFYVCTCL